MQPAMRKRPCHRIYFHSSNVIFAFCSCMEKLDHLSRKETHKITVLPSSIRDTVNFTSENSAICDSTSMLSSAAHSSNSAASSESGHENSHNPYHLRSSNGDHAKPTRNTEESPMKWIQIITTVMK
uniref:Uncharacterized protein n=1 Tax=Romanomermis culicivorax TaxID=13658 RepID=A0A915HG47_ROMCU